MQPADSTGAVGPQIVMVSIVLATFAIIFLLLRRLRKQHSAKWMAYAQARGFSFTSSTGFGPAYQGPRMEGTTTGGLPLLIDGYFHRMGRGPVFVTRVTRAWPASGAVGVRPRNAMLLYGEELKGVPVDTGDGAFDSTFLVAADPPGVEAALLREPLRASLVGFAIERRDTYLDASGGELVLRWFGFEEDTAVLDEACRLIEALDERRSVRPPG